MPVTGGHMKVTYRYTYLGQKCENVQWYRLDGAAFLTADVLGVLTALWADVKGVLRGIMPASTGVASWDSMLGEELGGGLGYAEYGIPVGEQVGLRAIPDGNLMSPSFVAGGFRQTVASRVTKPGQKRFPFVYEADTVNNVLQATYLGLLGAVGAKFSTASTLGAPVATGLMHPEIVGTYVAHSPTVFQDVTGYLVNSFVTSQVSRKQGHGS